MNKKAFLAAIAIVSLLFSLGPHIHAANAQSSDAIIISTGIIEGTDKIQRVGDVYTFSGDISGEIVIESDNLVLDGKGYVLTPQNNDGTGMGIRGKNNVTLRNLTIKGFIGRCGILLIDATNCSIIQNNLTSNLIGFEMTGTSSRNIITENYVQNNSVGMEIYSANPGSDNTISENKVTNNSFGMQVKDFLNTDILRNNVSSNSYGLGLGLGSGSTAKNNIIDNNTYGFRAFNVQAVNVDIDSSNTVNGKPILYWVNQHDRTVPSGACYVALVGCSGIHVENLDLSGNLEGLFLGSTSNSTITNSRFTKCLFGINLDASSNNTIRGNIITENENGVRLIWSSLNNTIQGNDLSENAGIGIFIVESSQNTIIENKIAGNDKGVYTEYCGTNTIYHNNFVNNTKQWGDIGFTPWPIPLPFSPSVWDDGKAGNYWSNYNGTDLNGDGIGDSPFILGTKNQDNYPLMRPYDLSGSLPTPTPTPTPSSTTVPTSNPTISPAPTTASPPTLQPSNEPSPSIPEFPSWTILLVATVAASFAVLTVRNIKRRSQSSLECSFNL
jgi:parallel beta-helix repeat protein